jgi:TetR/AcrR family transcriptional repressor of lmrAB and yxaGH operons
MSVGIDKPKSRDGRERLLNGAQALLAERGYSAMELRDVAERGDAPRGSIYHHFPGGKAQLAAEATQRDGARIRDAIEASIAERGLKPTLHKFGDLFKRRAANHPERIGCPIAAAAVAQPNDPQLAAAATEAFRSWEAVLVAALRAEGLKPKESEAFAALTVSTIEGALIRTRAAGDHEPLDYAIAGLETALDGLLRP